MPPTSSAPPTSRFPTPAASKEVVRSASTSEQAALVKPFTTTRMRGVVAWARELFGGNGIVLDYEVAEFFSDAEAVYSFEGSREMSTLIVAKAITGRSAFA